MALELVVICILSALLVVHIWFDRMYSVRIRRFGTNMDEIDRSYIPDEMYEESLDCARMHAKAEEDRRSNRDAVTVHAVCVAGLVIMYVLNAAGLVDAMGWTSILVVALSAYHSIDHIRTAILPYKLKHRSLMGKH